MRCIHEPATGARLTLSPLRPANATLNSSVADLISCYCGVGVSLLLIWVALSDAFKSMRAVLMQRHIGDAMASPNVDRLVQRIQGREEWRNICKHDPADLRNWRPRREFGARRALCGDNDPAPNPNLMKQMVAKKTLLSNLAANNITSSRTDYQSSIYAGTVRA